jgi:hypothetical protein
MDRDTGAGRNSSVRSASLQRVLDGIEAYLAG